MEFFSVFQRRNDSLLLEYLQKKKKEEGMIGVA